MGERRICSYYVPTHDLNFDRLALVQNGKYGVNCVEKLGLAMVLKY